MKPARASRGFTLIEVVISLTLFSLIMISVIACWKAVVRGKITAEAAAAAAQRARIGMKSVEDALSCAEISTRNLQFYVFSNDTSGTFAYLSLAARLPAAFPGSGLFGDNVMRRVTFDVETGADKQNDLVMTQSPLLEALDQVNTPYPITLARDVTAFMLEFWSPEQADWVVSYDPTNNFPLAIRVTLGVGHSEEHPDAPYDVIVRTVSMPLGPPLTMKIHPKKSPDGFALILVMLTIISLTALVASLAISMNTEVRLARNADYDAELLWMGRSGIELAEFALANKCAEQKSIDALSQFWAGGTAPCSNDIPDISLKNVPLGHGQISVTITDMERKWDINLVANPAQPQMDVLQRALAEVGVTDAALNSTIIDSILDWCSPAFESRFSGAKDDFYTHLNPPYYCKDGPIDDLNELLLIKGMTPEIFWGSNATNHPVSAFQQHGGGAFAQPTSGGGGGPGFRNSDEPVYPVGLRELFSPMGGKLNINTASLKTLQLIPGMDEASAEAIIRQRSGPDGIDGTDDDAPFQNIGEINGGIPGGGGVPPNVPAGAPPPALVSAGAQPNVPGAPPLGVAAQGLANYIDVRSYVFEVRVDAEISGYKRAFYGIVSRGGGAGQNLKCVKFYWE